MPGKHTAVAAAAVAAAAQWLHNSGSWTDSLVAFRVDCAYLQHKLVLASLDRVFGRWGCRCQGVQCSGAMVWF